MASKKAAKRAQPRESLSLERIQRSALALIEKHGLPAFSQRALARELGVEAMSLYHHVPNKDAILDGVVDVVFAAIELPDARAGWRDAIRDHASSARKVLSRHRWALTLVDSRRNPGPMTLRRHNAFLGALREAGFPVPMAMHAISLIDSYVNGFVLQETSLPDGTEEVAAAIQTDGLPYLQEAIAHHANGYDLDSEFNFGLDLILDALAARVRG